jgi:2-polyprenyl-3-methyl-5-hydroxy-6-metoxy-1,4-benzoquinol methylase
MKKFNCPLCESNKTYCYNKDIYKCLSCDNFHRVDVSTNIYNNYTNKLPMPTYFDSKVKTDFQVNFLLNHLDLTKVNSILEIGSGSGELIKKLQKNCSEIRITIIEPGRAFVEELKTIPNVTVINTFLEECEINQKFDLIILSHVLEHFKTPKLILDNLYKNNLSQNGFLYIDIPNSNYELRNEYASIIAPIIHISFFSPSGIINILKSVGFNNGSIQGKLYSSLPVSYINNQNRLVDIKRKSKKNITIELFFKIRGRLIFLFSSISKYYLRTSVKQSEFTDSSPNYNNIALIAQKSKIG